MGLVVIWKHIYARELFACVTGSKLVYDHIYHSLFGLCAIVRHGYQLFLLDFFHRLLKVFLKFSLKITACRGASREIFPSLKFFFLSNWKSESTL